MILNINEIATYIQNRLLEEGTVVKHDDIVKILNFELDYLIDLGLAEVHDD